MATLQFGSAVLSPLAIDNPGTVGLLGLVGWLIWVVAYGITLIRPTSIPHPAQQRVEPPVSAGIAIRSSV